MDLFERRDKLFDLVDRDILGPTDVMTMFVELMLEADCDSTAISLCKTSPEWFRKRLRAEIQDRVQSGVFVKRWYAIGESRTMEQAEADAKRHGSILERLSSEILVAI